MKPLIFLDSGPLGLLTHPRRTTEVVAITEWLSQMFKEGRRVLVPAIVYYELKRELLRAAKHVSRNVLLPRCSVHVRPTTGTPAYDPAIQW